MSDCGNAVGFLHPQFLSLADDGGAVGKGASHRQHRKLVDQLRNFFSLNNGAFQHGTRYFHDAAWLELIHIFDRFANLGSHADQHTEHRCACGIQAEFANKQMSSGLRGCRCQPVSGRGEITGNSEVARLWNLIAKNRDGAVFIPRRANKEVTQHSLGVIARLRFLDNCGFSFGKKTGEQDCAFHLRAGDRHLIANSAQRAPANAQRWGLVGTFRGNVCSHPLQWSNDAIHRPPGKRSVSHQAALKCLPCEKSRHQPHGGSGVAAINVAGRRTEHSLFSMDDNCIALRLIDPNPERAQRINGTHTIVAHEESIEAANSVGQRTDDGGAMRNALVPGHGDFRVDVRCAFDAKFHLTFRIPSRPKPGRRNHPISGALVQQPDSFTRNEARFLRHQKDLVGIGIFHFGSRWEPPNINIALIRCVGAGDKSGFIRHRNAVREIALGRPRGR